MSLTDVIKGAFAHGDYALALRAAEVSLRRSPDMSTAVLQSLAMALPVVLENHELYDRLYTLLEPKLAASEFERFATRRDLLSEAHDIIRSYDVMLEGACACGVELPQQVHDRYAALLERANALCPKPI